MKFEVERWADRRGGVVMWTPQLVMIWHSEVARGFVSDNEDFIRTRGGLHRID
jgi:hypothetical protein